MLNGRAAVEPVRVPQVDVVDAHTLQAFLARLSDICRVAAETEIPVLAEDAAEFRGEEYVGALAGLGEPFPDEIFRVSLVRSNILALRIDGCAVYIPT